MEKLLKKSFLFSGICVICDRHELNIEYYVKWNGYTSNTSSTSNDGMGWYQLENIFVVINTQFTLVKAIHLLSGYVENNENSLKGKFYSLANGNRKRSNIQNVKYLEFLS